MTRLKRWLLAGLILVAPAAITFVALRWLFDHLDRPLRTLLARTTGYDIPGAGLVSVLILLLATGAVASTVALRTVVRLVERTLDRIPLVRTLYSGVKQLLSPLAEEHGGGFQKVVVVAWPDTSTYALGFLIRQEAGVSPQGEPLAAVLVPTNHLHLGNVVLCPRSRIHEVDLSAEEGLRFLVSMGAALDHKLQLRPGGVVPPPPPA